MSYKPYSDVFERESDFRVKYRLFSPEEGGRYHPAFQGIRWNFYYPTGGRNQFMIYPEFEDSGGRILDANEQIEDKGFANMWIFNDEMFKYHKERIELGTRGNFSEGSKFSGECEVVDLNFEKTINIYRFKEKHPNRAAFVKLLAEHHPELNLREARQLMKAMLGGNLIQYRIDNYQVKYFTNTLNELNLEYEIR